MTRVALFKSDYGTWQGTDRIPLQSELVGRELLQTKESLRQLKQTGILDLMHLLGPRFGLELMCRQKMSQIQTIAIYTTCS